MAEDKTIQDKIAYNTIHSLSPSNSIHLYRLSIHVNSVFYGPLKRAVNISMAKADQMAW